LRFADARTSVEVSTVIASPRRFRGTPRVNRPGLLVVCSLTSSSNCTRLFRRVGLGVVSSITGGVKRSDSMLGANRALAAVLAAIEVSDGASTLRSVCVAAKVDIFTIIIE
jgi:hypothetical protein